MKDEIATRARELRRDSSRAERIRWELLRSRRLNDVKFRLQHPIGPYFADFACVSKKLIVEIDGEHHAYQMERDAVVPLLWNGRGGACCASGRAKS